MKLSTLKWLNSIGYERLEYPRWQSIRYGAIWAIDEWKYMKKFYYKPSKERAIKIIKVQVFTGIMEN